MKKHEHLVLNEFRCLFVDKQGKYSRTGNDGDIGVPKQVFEEIETFVLQSEKNDCFALKPGYKRKYGTILQAQQFVGVIETHNGTVIEILPKINENGSEDATRKTFLKMLASLRDSPFVELNSADLKTDRFHLLEVFITLFVRQLDTLIKKGIRQNYSPVRENSPFLKGKLQLKEHLQYNSVHRERFFVEYDQFCSDIPENRIIKETLQYLYKRSRSWSNQQRLREFMFVFDEVPTSKNVQQDCKKIQINRQMHHYQTVIEWCKIFLKQKSFTTFSGNAVAFAILFDMNRIFEDFVAAQLKKQLDESVRAQVASKYLVERPKKFRLRPDILIGDDIVADTKWKLISGIQDISQADMYQMYAYAKKYERDEVWLIYPKSQGFQASWQTGYHFYEQGDQRVCVLCFDCESAQLN